jgi:predicted transcriptional regulator
MGQENSMGQENTKYLAEKEEGLVNLLCELGMKRNVAKVLVVLAKTPKVTSRAIVQGTVLRHLEVVAVLQYLKKQGWIKSQEHKATHRGRPVKIYELAKPIAEIVNSIEKEKITKTNNQLQLIQKLRNCVSKSYDPALNLILNANSR